MTHYRAMQEKLAGDVEDSQLHYLNHGVYEDVRLPHRDTDNDTVTDSDRLEEASE